MWVIPSGNRSRRRVLAHAASKHCAFFLGQGGSTGLKLHRIGLGLILAALGGGGKYYPLTYFLNNWKTTADIDAKLSVPYPAWMWPTQISEKSENQNFRNFSENYVLVKSCSAILGQKATNVWMLLELQFKVKRKLKTPNGVILSLVQNGYFGFLKFLNFDAQNPKFRFFENNCQ